MEICPHLAGSGTDSARFMLPNIISDIINTIFGKAFDRFMIIMRANREGHGGEINDSRFRKADLEIWQFLRFCIYREISRARLPPGRQARDLRETATWSSVALEE